MAKKIFSGKYKFIAAEQTISLPGDISADRLLVITNTTLNQIIYNFANPLLGYDSVFYDFEADRTLISLAVDTASMSDNDDLQIFLEEDSQEITPADDLLDAVGKLRVSNPENLIDTDFEYGLQSTKWETAQTVNNIPTVYSSSGDTPLDGIVSVDAISGSKNILVNFNIPHGLNIGDPISVQGVSQYQAEGSFIITSVPDLQSFYFELDVPALFSGDISGSYTNIVPGKFFEGSTLPVSTADGAVTDDLDPSTISVTTKETHGFSPKTKVYLRNTVGPRVLNIADSTLTAPDGRPYVDTTDSFPISLDVDNSLQTGRGTASDRATTSYDWESTYTFYLSPGSVNAVSNEITWNGHNLRDKYALLFNTPYHGLTDAGLADGTVYYVDVIDANTIQLHANENLTSLVSLSNLDNTYGFARLGLVYKVEAANGTIRNTEANIVNATATSGYTQQDGGQIISNPDGPSNRTTNVDVTAVLGGNPTNLKITEFLIAGDFNGGTETITVTIGNTTITSNSGQQSASYFRMRDDRFSNDFDVTPFLFVQNGRTYFTIQHNIPAAVDNLGYFNPVAGARINMRLETVPSPGGLLESDKEFSGGDLFDSVYGLGSVAPIAILAFQGRSSNSYTNAGDAFSYQINQRNNGRYGTLSIKYQNVLSSDPILDGNFTIDFNDNLASYGTGSEIFYAFVRPVAATRNTLLIPGHGIDTTAGPQTINVTVDATEYANGTRFGFGDGTGTVTNMPELFQAEVTVVNQDTIRLTTTQFPNTNDIARFPGTFNISYTKANELYNSIYVSNHKVRANTLATYTNVSGDPIPPLIDNDSIELTRVDDSRLKLAQAGSGESGSSNTTIGSTSSALQSFFIPIETQLAFTPTAAQLTSIDFRGDFSGSNEYVDIQFDDNDSYRIGANDDIGDSSTFTTSTTFTGKDVTSLLVNNGGVIGFNISVDPANAVNFVPGGMSNWWDLRLNYDGSSAGFVFEGPGTGSHEFLVNNLVGAYDGIFEITSVDQPNTFAMLSDFKIPKRQYEFISTDINTGNNSITLSDPHNLITGEKITYVNNGNSNVLDIGGGTEFFAIVVSDTSFKVASSNSDALLANGLTLTPQTGTHSFDSSSVIKNIKSPGSVSITTGSNRIIGTGTNFLTNFKRFDKIYINNGTFVQEFTVNTITTQQKMTVFEESQSTLSSADYYFATQLSLRPDGFSLHLPFDGGVDITAGTSPNSKIVRQSRKYFRYQSGKGIQNSFAINFNPPKLVRELIKSAGIVAEVKTQEQHNLNVGDIIRVSGATVEAGVNTYNGSFQVVTIPDEFTFTYNMIEAPVDVRAGGFPIYVRDSWTDSFIRAGMFDDQNGFFYEFDGQKLYAVRRSSTQQLAGNVNVKRASQVVEGNGTSFNSQLKNGEYIVIRGQSYKIVEISSDQRLIIQPEYRGIDSDRVKLTKTVDTRTPQEDWNIDPADGTGTTRYNLDINKIQMAYIDYSWYGAGKIRYGFKDNNGHVRYFHEYKHNNRLVESYFRSGNLPGRYEISNGPQSSTAPTLFHFGTSVIMDGRFDDDKAYQFAGQSKPFAFTNGANSTFATTAESSFNQVTLGGNRVFVYSLPVDEATAQSAVEGLQIAVSGSSELPDGSYVTQVKVDGANSRIFTNYPATTTDPTGGATYPVIANASSIIIGEQSAIDLSRPIPLISVRLAPSVDSSVTGALGEREIINRMQLKLKEASVTSNAAIEIFLLQNSTPSEIDYQKAPRPSLSEIIEHSAGDTLLEGTTIYSSKSSAGSITFSLEELLEIGNSILGGDGIFPAGPDLLTLAFLPQNTSEISGANPLFVSGKISWSESQA